MAGRAIRIYNFCHQNPSSPGCPWPQYGPYVPPVNPCLDPLSIGTTACKQYTTYVNVKPLNQDNLLTVRTPIPIIGPPTSQYYTNPPSYFLGYTTTSFAKMFEFYTPNDQGGTYTNQIGDVEISYRAIYDTPQSQDPSSDDPYTGPSNVSANATVNWFQPNNTSSKLGMGSPPPADPYLKASLSAVFTYHLNDISGGAGYPGPFQTNSISTGQQLFGKKVLVDSTIEITPGSDLTIANKLVFNLS